MDEVGLTDRPRTPRPGYSYAIELQPKGDLRLLGPLLAPIVRSGLKKDLHKLKALLNDGH